MIDPARTHAVRSAEEPNQSHRITRRQVLQGGVAASAAFAGIAQLAPHWSFTKAQSDSTKSTLTVATNRTPMDLDPHSAYDLGSLVALRGQFETLIQVVPGTSDELAPMIARSWESNEDKSIWTFRLNDGVTFQDGAPCDAEA